MRGGRSQILYQYQFRDAFSDGVGQTAQFPIAEGTVQGLRLFVEVAHHQRNASGSLHTGHGFELREKKMPHAAPAGPGCGADEREIGIQPAKALGPDPHYAQHLSRTAAGNVKFACVQCVFEGARQCPGRGKVTLINFAVCKYIAAGGKIGLCGGAADQFHGGASCCMRPAAAAAALWISERMRMSFPFSRVGHTRLVSSTTKSPVSGSTAMLVPVKPVCP